MAPAVLARFHQIPMTSAGKIPAAARENAQATIDKLAAAGWQDDARFAASVVRNRASGGYGPAFIRAELGTNDQLFLVLGWDAFCGLPGWHRWEELLQHCHILVLQRPDADVEPPDELRNLLAARSESDPTAMSGPAGNISFVWQTPLAVSATQIRQLLASGKSVRFLVPDAVLAYIEAHDLYRGSN